MERYLVLGKFYSVSEKLKKDKLNHQKIDGVETNEMANISPSGRNILCHLLVNDNLNQRAISKKMNLSAQAISENLKKLERSGYIIRTDGTQNNENMIRFTLEGEKMAMKLDKKIRSHAKEVFKEMSEEEIEKLYYLLDKML